MSYAVRHGDEQLGGLPPNFMTPDFEALQGSARAYLDALANIPLLTEAQEAQLASRVAEGDQNARQLLIEHNLRFVLSVARQYQGLGLPLEDLIGEGTIGLVRATERYDPSKGRFTTYAFHWIKQSIRRALDNTARTIRLPSYVRSHLSRMTRLHQHFFEHQGHDPSAEYLAERLDLAVSTVQHIRIVGRKVMSLDVPISTFDDITWAELLVDENLPPHDEELLETEEHKAHFQYVHILLSHLTERERQVIILHFGLEGTQIQSLADIGRMLGVSRERVRQIADSAMNKLQAITCGKKQKKAFRAKQVS
ncbi:MAG TPA: RNA polymerase sigma factor RpoD/SigA [Ktedonosporobacter sp.]|nr:RNA polymerase sigma factor RpoD/SigA [Ktedonosporobacter sp.]